MTAPGASGVLAGRYELEKRIGSGGAADVVRAVDLPLGRPVAVKIFRPGGDPELETGLAEEAALLARLRHPGLVTVYDAGVHEERPYLVMELVEGPTLRQRLREETLSAADTRRLGERLADALAHVHEAGIVHRDVKPSNILLDGDGRPHLTDFGIARLADATTRTRSGMFTGTAAYMSPEQVRGDRPGPASDVYALGLVLLECLTGELEYEGTPLESAVARLHRAPAIPEDLPAELRDLLTSMTGTEPEERPDALTCAEWLAVGRTASAPLPPELPPEVPARGASGRRPGLRRPLAALGTLAAVLGAGIALAAAQSDPPLPPERSGPTTAVESEHSPSPGGEGDAAASPTPTRESGRSAGRQTTTPPVPAHGSQRGPEGAEEPKAPEGGPPEDRRPPAAQNPGPPEDRGGGPPAHRGKPPHAGP